MMLQKIHNKLADILADAATARINVVQFVDQLFELFRIDGLCLRLDSDYGVVYAEHDKNLILIQPNPLTKSQFRAVLARVACLSSEVDGITRNPYGGEWSVATNEKQITISMANTLDTLFVAFQVAGRRISNQAIQRDSISLAHVHQRVSEIESDLFAEIAQTSSTPGEIVPAFLSAMAGIKSVFEEMVPNSAPQMLMLAGSTRNELPACFSSLRGFDELFNSAILADEIQQHTRALERVPFVVHPSSQDSEVKEWLKSQQVGLVITMPIWISVSRRLERAGFLTLVLGREFPERLHADLEAILHRVGLLFQFTIQIAQVAVRVEDPTNKH